ncbi:dUTP diphosphatase [Paenibacillus sp. FSL E2-0202]|uniref:dUTP diphosphatase n=1 Tax=Paenibacillus sp. FSL E2-0202 TaxID=2954505 RepID=UPI0030EC5801
MTLTLEEMYNMQKELDAKIVAEKGLEGQDLLYKRTLALQIELAECANEYRGFKFWSDRSEPKHGYDALIECPKCSGKGFWFSGERVICGRCDEKGKITNPLLEEFVDCVHFFLSIAGQYGWLDALYISEDAIEETRDEGLDGEVTGAFLESMYWLMKFHMERDRDEKIEQKLGKTKREMCFRNAWYVFFAIGLVGFNFTFEQIADAYAAKNKVNHERQVNGY